MCTVTEETNTVSGTHSPRFVSSFLKVFCFLFVLFPAAWKLQLVIPPFGVGVRQDRRECRESAGRSSVKFAGRYEVSPPIAALSSPPAVPMSSPPAASLSSPPAVLKSSPLTAPTSGPLAVAHLGASGSSSPVSARSAVPRSRGSSSPVPARSAVPCPLEMCFYVLYCPQEPF